jgi:hypothetical protein
MIRVHRTVVAFCGLLAATEGCGSPEATRRVARPASPLEHGKASPDDAPLVAASRLCVTAGRTRPSSAHTFSVDAGGMRAVVAGEPARLSRSSPRSSLARLAEMAFTYNAPSSSTTLLANGTLRRQVGLKLRAKDTCNVVYVMWHIAPTSGIFVSVKHNPRMSTHAECGPKGYIGVQPRSVRALTPVQAGESHTLRAVLEGTSLRVITDGAVAWEGTLPSEALTFDGPVGVRSDNVAFDFELRADEADEPVTPAAPCAILRPWPTKTAR